MDLSFAGQFSSTFSLSRARALLYPLTDDDLARSSLAKSIQIMAAIQLNSMTAIYMTTFLFPAKFHSSHALTLSAETLRWLLCLSRRFSRDSVLSFPIR